MEQVKKFEHFIIESFGKELDFKSEEYKDKVRLKAFFVDNSEIDIIVAIIKMLEQGGDTLICKEWKERTGATLVIGRNGIEYTTGSRNYFKIIRHKNEKNGPDFCGFYVCFIIICRDNHN